MLLMFLVTQGLPAPSAFTNFVTVKGDRLMDGDKELRFISFNIPNLHCIEDNMAFTETNVWRLPNEYELRDALVSAREMGGTVVRMYTLSVRRKDDTPEIPRYVLGPGQFNEEAFQALDLALAVANEVGVRIIIPFVDNWSWMGGIAEYAGFRGQPAQAFWTDAEIKADFQKTIHYLINRTNTMTGIKYRDDKAVLAWETGNELKDCPDAWTEEMAAYIKKLDPNHLVLDGYHTSVLRSESVANRNTDIVTTHHYENDPRDMIEHIRISAARAKGKKPYLIGEFGFISTSGIAAVLDEIIAMPHVCGALIWSLRFHARDGGFYWHSEPAADGFYKAYHVPGFASGETYDEQRALAVYRQKAFRIRNLPLAAQPRPSAPHLLPADDVSKLIWQGVVFAACYDVERAESANGPWQIVGRDVSDAETAHRPLFNDESAEIGKSYFYRVRAKNQGGISEPSNVAGPIQVHARTLVDELINFGVLFSKRGKLTLQATHSRPFKEDAHRLRGEAGAEVVYYVPGSVREARCYGFANNVEGIWEVSASTDGQSYQPLKPSVQSFFAGKADYDYQQPLLLLVRELPGGSRYLKLRFLHEAQLSRVEISYAE